MNILSKCIAIFATISCWIALSAPRSAGQITSRREKQATFKASPTIPVERNVDAQNTSTQSIPEIRSATPGSPESNRISDIRRMVDAGLIPVKRLDGTSLPVFSAQGRPPLDIGTRLVPDPTAKGSMLQFQQKFSIGFMKLDPRPHNRLAHFTWLSNSGHGRLIGWSGAILGVQFQEDNSVLVKIRIYPNFYFPNKHVHDADHVEETYSVSDGIIQYVDSDAEIPKLHLQVIGTR